MRHPIIKQRLHRYASQTAEDEENALKEILQEIALYALSSTDFFTKALFQGGTALRILYQLPRFSEDLDFILKQPDPHFRWQPYLDEMSKAFTLFDIEPEIVDRNKASDTIQKLFLKDHSIGKLLTLHFPHHAHKKLLIKLEIDINPPSGSHEEITFLDFPMDYAISTQDLSSNFAGKCHALLCRPYIRGRDWFDFSWSIARKTPINLEFLKNAIQQYGPWAGQNIQVSHTWLTQALSQKVNEIDWKKAVLDASRFINMPYKDSLKFWNQAFFAKKIASLTA